MKRKTKPIKDPPILGTIELQDAPIGCHSCGKIMVNAFVRKDDPDVAKPMHILCNMCYDQLRRVMAWAEARPLNYKD